MVNLRVLILLRLTILLLSCRETETFESVAEDDQLPQVVEELHDVHVSPGAPFAKMHLKVKGKFINRDDQQSSCKRQENDSYCTCKGCI